MDEPNGLRERKKAACRRALMTAARELALDRGFDGFTIADVVERVDVSPRTFFNYFTTKEDAVIGSDPARIGDTAARLLARPSDESPLQALWHTLVDDTTDLEANAAGFSARIELVHRHPELMPRHLAAMHDLERALVQATAVRMGVDPTLDPYPTIVVTVAVAALRSIMLWWHQNRPADALAVHLDAAFGAIDRGLALPVSGRRR